MNLKRRADYFNMWKRDLEAKSKPIPEDVQITDNFTGLFYKSPGEVTQKAVAILEHENSHALWVHDIKGCQEKLATLLQMDRLPRFDTLEGLRLLRDAWDEVDIKMYLADRYKVRAKIFYALTLAVALVTVLFTTFQALAMQCELGENCVGYEATGLLPVYIIKRTIFFLSVAASILVSMIGFLNPVARWRQLRMAGCSLVSVIWQYRARVGEFTESAQNPLAAQTNFSLALRAWEESVTSGTDLQLTSLEKHWSQSIFRHCQRKGDLPKASFFPDAVDDFHSPVTPAAYLKTRLLPARDFYKARIPACTRSRWFWQHVVFFCSAGSSVLAYADESAYVAVVTAFATAVVSWTEFSQLDAKVQRYTTAIQAIKNLHRWWLCLSEVEQKNRDNVTRLVLKGEGIITAQSSAWSSTIVSFANKDEDTDKTR